MTPNRPPAAPLAAALALLAPLCAGAHEGHGLAGVSHWHASDVLGFVAALCAGAAALWWSRRK